MSASKARRARRSGGRFSSTTIDRTIEDAANGFAQGCEPTEIRAELLRRGFNEGQAFLLATAGRLLAAS